MALETGNNPFDLSGTAPALPQILAVTTPILMAPPQALEDEVQIASANPTEDEIRAYVKEAATKRGIDPNIAQTVVHGEGGYSDPYQRSTLKAPASQDPSLGKTENSYGPFQLYISGKGKGLGDAALAAGVDPRKDWRRGVDFALDHASKNGWGDWYGAKANGITGMMGIHGGGSAGAPATSGSLLAATRHQAPTADEIAQTNEVAGTPEVSDAGISPDARTALMKMMLAASLANFRLQPVDYDPYKVMPKL